MSSSVCGRVEPVKKMFYLLGLSAMISGSTIPREVDVFCLLSYCRS